MSADVADAASIAVEPQTPLVVDVDGTLLATDLLHEAALQFVAAQPLRALDIVVWLARGKSNLKVRLADHTDPGIESVPLRAEVVDLIRAAQAERRPVYLASASDRRYVDAVAERIGGIAGTFGTDETVNLSGKAKADRLVAAFGIGGYDYVGDMKVDFPVWNSARKQLVVARSARFADRAIEVFPGAAIVARPKAAVRDYVRALRPHQWAKNVLLFLPMIAGHRFDPRTLVLTAIGFGCFCLAASSAYVLNDLLDLRADRDHPRKARRPFASGRIPISHGVVLSALALAAAFGLASFLPVEFVEILATYVALTLSYSLFLKRNPLIDVVTLSGLYTIRVYGGLAAVDVQQTQWLLMFSLFFFLSLALVKRCSELVVRGNMGKTTVMGRGYRGEDLHVLLSLGAAAGYGAVFVVTLYLSSPDVKILYTHPGRMWLICPVLIYWISRVLVMSNRGDLHDDPVVFALTDRISWATVACVGLILLVSL
jgi:4-hydroxybenzoate polyprenyltransferase